MKNLKRIISTSSSSGFERLYIFYDTKKDFECSIQLSCKGTQRGGVVDEQGGLQLVLENERLESLPNGKG